MNGINIDRAKQHNRVAIFLFWIQIHISPGYKIEYCAGADALTFAPETFHEFYIQRRRWSPSTMANLIDLIGSWRIPVKMNDNISVLFMLYQFVLMASSIFAPGNFYVAKTLLMWKRCQCLFDYAISQIM